MTSFRPRAIDLEKPLLIMREELNDEETRSMPAPSTGMEHHEENEAHIRQAIMEAQRKSTRITAEIPTPVVKEVPSYDADTSRWAQPSSYIHVTPPLHLLFRDVVEEIVEYDLDSEDEAWLGQEINRNHTPVLSDEAFELLIDTFEKALAHRQILSLQSKEVELSQVEAVQAIEELNRGLPGAVVEATFDYWKQKRQKKKRSLLLSLVPPPAYNDPSPLIPFRPRERETRKRSRKNNVALLKKLQGLQLEMEKGKQLLEMIQQREVMKKQFIDAERQVFETRAQQRQHVIQNPRSDAPEHLRGRKLYSFESSDDEGPAQGVDAMEAETDVEMEELPKEEELPEEPPLVPHSEWDRCPEHYHNEENNPPGEVYWNRIRVPGMAPFRGRVRMGRGGRLFVDRASARVPREGPTSPILYY